MDHDLADIKTLTVQPSSHLGNASVSCQTFILDKKLISPLNYQPFHLRDSKAKGSRTDGSTKSDELCFFFSLSHSLFTLFSAGFLSNIVFQPVFPLGKFRAFKLCKSLLFILSLRLNYIKYFFLSVWEPLSPFSPPSNIRAQIGSLDIALVQNCNTRQNSLSVFFFLPRMFKCYMLAHFWEPMLESGSVKEAGTICSFPSPLVLFYYKFIAFITYLFIT